MRTPLALFRFVVKAGLNYVGFGVAGDLAVEVLPDLARDVWNAWGKGQREEQLRQEIQAVAALPDAEARSLAAEAAAEEAAALPEERRKALTVFASQLPAAVRASQRRPADPTGRTVSPALRLQEPNDLLPLLPVRLPKFSAGMQAPGFGDWVLEELLGVGGFGEVWRARNVHLASEPPAAIKFCLDTRAAQMLRNEASLLDRVRRHGRHAGIVALHDTALSSNPPALRYEYVSGGDLCGLVQQWRANPPADLVPRVLRLLEQIARSVSFAHGVRPEPIVHRDLKPANILLQPGEGGEVARVADFGIGGVVARRAIDQANVHTTRGEFLTQALRGACTPLYASARQRRGEGPDPRDDVYSLGVIGYQLLLLDLTAEPGADFIKRLTRRGVPADITDLLSRCLSSDPEDQPFADAGALADELRKVIPASSPAPLAPQEQPAQRPAPATAKASEADPLDPALVKVEQMPIAPLDVRLHARPAAAPPPTDLPPLPADILELEGKLAALTQALEQLEAGTHPDLEQARRAIEAAEQQHDRLKQDLAANTPPLNPQQRILMAEAVERDPELQDPLALCDIAPEQPTRVLIPYLRRLRNVELARKALEAARKQRGERLEAATSSLREQREETAKQLASRRREDLVAALAPAFAKLGWSGAFPLEAWEQLEPQLEQRRYGLTDRELLQNAQAIWKGRLTGWEGRFSALVAEIVERREDQLTDEDRREISSAARRLGLSKERARELALQERRRWHTEPKAGRLMAVTLPGNLELKLACIPPGTFLMGSPPTEPGRNENEGPQHKVTLTKGFYLGVYPVTQAQFQAVMGLNTSQQAGPDRPVEMVTWHQAFDFCARLAKLTGKPFRLPTEAEWEYACRAGTSTPFYSGTGEAAAQQIAWCASSSKDGARPQPVGKKKPNAWGLYDMAGNVWEWCLDGCWKYSEADAVDPVGPHKPDDPHIIRGGAWCADWSQSRSASRLMMNPGFVNSDRGFRVAMSME